MSIHAYIQEAKNLVQVCKFSKRHKLDFHLISHLESSNKTTIATSHNQVLQAHAGHLARCQVSLSISTLIQILV